MTPNPILKVLSTLTKHQVQFLLMGGQACVFYGAAEFSRDTDIALLLDPANLDRLRSALDELQARRIAVPPFDPDYLKRGHAVHFRCQNQEANGVRLDVMAVMRNVAPFEELWQRRRTLEVGEGLHIELMGVDDLVKAKKTQRDKDWPMIRRLVEAHYHTHKGELTPERIEFWLLEARSVPLLLEVANLYPEDLKIFLPKRPLLSLAQPGTEEALTRAIEEEERSEREADRLYWSPLKKELERLRHQGPSP